MGLKGGKAGGMSRLSGVTLVCPVNRPDNRNDIRSRDKVRSRGYGQDFWQIGASRSRLRLFKGWLFEYSDFGCNAGSKEALLDTD